MAERSVFIPDFGNSSSHSFKSKIVIAFFSSPQFWLKWDDNWYETKQHLNDKRLKDRARDSILSLSFLPFPNFSLFFKNVTGRLCLEMVFVVFFFCFVLVCYYLSLVSPFPYDFCCFRFIRIVLKIYKLDSILKILSFFPLVC